MNAPSKSTILIVDDDPRGREVLQNLLVPEGHHLEMASSGMEALAKAKIFKPDVMLLDIMMPDMDGFDVCKALRDDPQICEIPVILVTALDDRDSLLQGLEVGADEFITKPFNRLEMRTRVRSVLRLNRFQHLNRERKVIEETLQGTVSLLSELLSLSDPHAFGHSQATRDRARQIAEAMSLPDLRTLDLAALLSSLGCMLIPDTTVEKARGGGDLNAAERDLWTRIPEYSRNLIRRVPQFQKVADIVYNQNKNYDGSGFPATPARQDMIPIESRILRIASDLTTLEQQGHPAIDAFTDMHARDGTYDPSIMEVLAQLLSAQSETEEEFQVVVREARFSQLQVGWKLRQDLLLRDGTLLLTSGNIISGASYERILNFASITGIREPILVEYTERRTREAALTTH